MGAQSMTQSRAAPHKSLLGTFTTSQTAISVAHHSFTKVTAYLQLSHPTVASVLADADAAMSCHTQLLPLCLQMQTQP